MLILPVALLLAAAPAARTAAPPEVAVAAVLDDWHDAAARADESRYFGHFAPGAVFLGTDGSERWTLPDFHAFAKPYFAKGKAWSFHATSRHVSIAPGGDVAWFDEDLATANLGPARGSGVLLRGERGWKIAQYNLSVPIPNALLKEIRDRIAGHRAPPPKPRFR